LGEAVVLWAVYTCAALRARGVVLKKKWVTPETRLTKIYSYIEY